MLVTILIEVDRATVGRARRKKVIHEILGTRQQKTVMAVSLRSIANRKISTHKKPVSREKKLIYRTREVELITHRHTCEEG